MNRPESNAVFRLLKRGLVVIEHSRNRDYFMIVRPACLAGFSFRGWTGVVNVGMDRTSVPTNAPPAVIRREDGGWLVDISSVAAPGPGPVWFHETFDKCDEAVQARMVKKLRRAKRHGNRRPFAPQRTRMSVVVSVG